MSKIYSNSIVDRLLGCLIQNPQLLLDSKYKLDKEEFESNKFHQIIYVCIYNMSINGYKSISLLDLNAFLSPYEAQYQVYLDGNGDNYTSTIIELTDTNNFDAYYDDFKKLSCLRMYKSNGFDITKFWNEELSDEKNLENVNQYTIEDILDYYESLQVGARKFYSTNSNIEEEYQAGTNFMETKEQFKETPLIGNSFQSEYLNGIFNGMFGFGIRVAKSGGGKAQPIDTVIPTPIGYRRLGDIKVGDYVYDRFGKPTKVLGTFPQGKLDCYTVTLSDGRTTQCNDEHLWSYYSIYSHNKEDRNKLITKTLKEISELSNTVYIPTNKAIEYENKQYDIDPYVIGAFLGDGCCREKVLTLSSGDEELVDTVAKCLDSTYVKQSNKTYSWCFVNPMYGIMHNSRKDCKLIQTKHLFEKYEDELCVYSYEKKIPNEYKYGSIEQRFALIQGMMDTDGNISVDGNRYNMSYSTTSLNLANDFMEVVRSLGYICSLRVDSRKDRRDCYDISICVDNSEKHKFFRLTRKLNIAKDAINHKKRRNYDRIGIKSIVKENYQKEMMCIYVDNEEHLYLTNDYIVTHNTILGIGDMLKASALMYWDYNTNTFVENKSRCGSALFINTELEIREELDPIMIAWISGVPRNHITKGIYEQGEEERVERAYEILLNSGIYIADMPNFTAKSLSNIIKDYVLNKNVQTVCFDYIQAQSYLLKELSSETKVPMREDSVLLTLTDRLKQVQRECGVSLISAVQTNGQEDNMEYPTEACLAGGKAQVRKTNFTMVMLPPKKKELAQTELLIQKWNKKYNSNLNFGKSIYPNNVVHIIKGRNSSYPKNIKVFQYADLGTGRTTDMFCTNKDNEPIEIEKLTIEC